MAKQRHAKGFAILRVELPFREDKLETDLSVKRVMWDEDDAQREAARLNKVNDGKCRYVVVLARVDVQGDE